MIRENKQIIRDPTAYPDHLGMMKNLRRNFGIRGARLYHYATIGEARGVAHLAVSQAEAEVLAAAGIIVDKTFNSGNSKYRVRGHVGSMYDTGAQSFDGEVAGLVSTRKGDWKIPDDKPEDTLKRNSFKLDNRILNLQ